MLSTSARPVVEATLPVVAEHIREIAQRFYEHMFAARPDLLDGLFNRGNQAEGTQQVALAGSVAAFATALVSHPEQLPDGCSTASRTSTRPWACAPTSTASCTSTCSGRSATSSATP
jgi:hemoglobin-like flavoprotein